MRMQILLECLRPENIIVTVSFCMHCGLSDVPEGRTDCEPSRRNGCERYLDLSKATQKRAKKSLLSRYSPEILDIIISGGVARYSQQSKSCMLPRSYERKEGD
jgi:hypothetical protein